MKPFRTTVRIILGVLCMTAMMPGKAMASITGTGLPWEHVLLVISQSLSGPVATSVAIISLAVACMVLMTDPGRGARMVASVVIGFSIVASAFGLMSLFGITTALI